MLDAASTGIETVEDEWRVVFFCQNERTNGTISDAVAEVTKFEGMTERKT
jgi:hypothetical protein